ncbi:MAG TPA: acyclic terpene utilization AtuA family protein, partial [Spongiibacteraceae bacterium]
MSDKKVLVANAQGFWGDSMLGPLRLIEEGPIDYLTFDYLAEITMSIMQKQKVRDSNLGYATDFVQLIGKIIKKCKERNIKIIANAGGVNLKACLAAIKKVIREQNITGVKIGIVEGDDILDQLPALIASGEKFSNLDSGENIASVRDRITSANVYIGAKPIADALAQGADIVVTGRSTDPSLVVAPLLYEFGWSMDDYDKLAAATVMGHIVECGPQCTGGNFTDWRQVPDMARIGYPIIEAKADGSFAVTKHANTGGLINVETVTSQLLYELGDPKNYLGPDCTADFTTINIAQDGHNRVKISGIKGRPPTPTYKVSMSYENGYKILSTLCISGPDAIEKAHVLAGMVFKRMEMHGAPIAEENRFLELFGTNVLYKGIVPTPEQPHEIMMRIGAKGADAKKLNILGTEIAPLITSGPPGVTGFAGGRARATEIVGYWPA